MYPDAAKDFETAAGSDASAAGSGRAAPGPADTPTRVLPNTVEASEQPGGSATTDTIAAGSGNPAPGGSALPDPHSPGGSQVSAKERRVDTVALAFIAAESGGHVTVESFGEKYGATEARILMERGRQKAREFLGMLDAAVKFDFDEMNRETEQRLLADLRRSVAEAGKPYPGNHPIYRYVGDDA